jgi:hypothetical protein
MNSPPTRIHAARVVNSVCGILPSQPVAGPTPYTDAKVVSTPSVNVENRTSPGPAFCQKYAAYPFRRICLELLGGHRG